MSKRAEKLMESLVNLEKGLKMKERAEILKLIATGCLFASIGLYSGSGLCKLSEGEFLEKASGIVDELKAEEDEEEE